MRKTFFPRLSRLLHVLFETTAHVFRVARATVFLLAFLVSVAFNIGTFAANVLGDIVSSALETVIDKDMPRTAMAKAEKRLTSATRKIVRTESKLLAATQAKARLEVRLARAVTSVTRQSLRLAKARTAAAVDFGKLVGVHMRLNDLQRNYAQLMRDGRTLMLRGQKVTERALVGSVTRSMKARGTTWAADTLGSAIGQAVPGYGAAVVVAVTAYDLKTMCDMMREADELDMAFNPGAQGDGAADKVCGLKPPTLDEVLQAIKASPGAVWQAIKATPGAAWDLAVSAGGAVSDGAAWAWQKLPDMSDPVWPEWSW